MTDETKDSEQAEPGTQVAVPVEGPRNPASSGDWISQLPIASPPPPPPGTVSQSSATTGGGSRQSATRPRRREQWLWLWPIVILAIMVLAETQLGSLGTFLSGVIAICILVLYIGNEVLGTGPRLAVTILTVLLVAGALIGRQVGIPFFSLKAASGLGAATPSATSPPLDLRGKRVTADDVEGKNLRGALLSGAILDGLDLHGFDLTNVQASGASFRRTVLDRALLQGADLRGADMRDACLYGADLTRAKLRGADATGADVTRVIADAATLSQAEWPSGSSKRSPLACGR